MLELIDSLGREKAVWVGHDVGSLVAWTVASHHPDRSHGIVSLCITHLPNGFAADNLIPLVDRAIYPENMYPAGQRDYLLFYQERFSAARAGFEADTRRTLKALLRCGNPALQDKPAPTSSVRRDGGRKIPEVERDAAVLTEADLAAYTAALERNSWFGPSAWYMNHKMERCLCRRSSSWRSIDHAGAISRWKNDFVCLTTDGSRLAEPMRRYCDDLTEIIIQSGHWMAQESQVAVNAALARWLATRLSNVWPS